MPPPPPADPSSSNDTASSTSYSSTSFDPLDTHQDGVASAPERAAADRVDLMKTLNSNGDVSKSEIGSFLKQLQSSSASIASTQAGGTATVCTTGPAARSLR